MWMSHVTYMRHDCMHHAWLRHVSFICTFASSIWKRHDATEYVNESCHVHETWLHASWMNESYLIPLLYCIFHMKETWCNRVCEWVMSHIWDMTACIMHEWIISHSFTLLHLPYERDMTQQSMWMSHVTYMHHAWHASCMNPTTCDLAINRSRRPCVSWIIAHKTFSCLSFFFLSRTNTLV